MTAVEMLTGRGWAALFVAFTLTIAGTAAAEGASEDAQDDAKLEDGDLLDLDDVAEPDPSDEEEAGADDDSEMLFDGPVADGDGAEADSETEPEPGPAMRVEATVGLGVGTLGYRIPRGFTRELLPDTAFAAIEGQLAIAGRLSGQLWLRGQLAFRTSLGLELEVMPQFALPERLTARVQGLEASVAPEFAVGPVTMAIPLGVATTVFSAPDHYLPVAGFAYGGPMGRVEALLPLSDQLSVQAGAEVQWLVLQAGSLGDQGLDPGWSWGYQAALTVAVSGGLDVALSYQERRASASGALGVFEGVERLLSARATGRF